MRSRGLRFGQGALLVDLPRGILLRVRWTLPLLFLGTLCWTPGSAIGCFLVVLAHELGHAVLARWRGLHVLEIAVHGLGGHCRHSSGSALDESIVAWGGVLAQAIVLAFTLPLYRLTPHWTFLGSLLYGLTIPNVLMIVSNLVPRPPLDGAKAWQLFGLLRRKQARARTVDAKWQAKDAAMWKAIEDAKARQRRND